MGIDPVDLNVLNVLNGIKLRGINLLVTKTVTMSGKQQFLWSLFVFL